MVERVRIITYGQDSFVWCIIFPSVKIYSIVIVYQTGVRMFAPRSGKDQIHIRATIEFAELDCKVVSHCTITIGDSFGVLKN